MFPVVVLLGARQCGKTTLAKMLGKDWKYFDLENGSDFDFITRDYDFFFQEYPERIILDEAQLSEELFQELRGVVDRDRSRKGRFILTGSSSPSLKTHLSESLAGRVGVVEMGTLKMNERYKAPLPEIYSILNGLRPQEQLNAFKKLEGMRSRDDVMTHFLYGGYPEPALEDTNFHEAWMANYVKTYIERDIRALFPGLSIENYRRFISMLSTLSGTIINRSELGRSLNVSEGTIRNYLDIAEGTHVWRSIPHLEKTVAKSVVKMPRGYIRDNGILHYLLRIRDLERLYVHPGVGASFEGFVTEEILQGLSVQTGSPWQVAYYRTRNGAEVALILISPDGDRIPVEIKFGVSTRASDLSGLRRFVEQESLPYGIVVNNAESVRMLTPNIIQIPAGSL